MNSAIEQASRSFTRVAAPFRNAGPRLVLQRCDRRWVNPIPMLWP